jgi:hypothetical protein
MKSEEITAELARMGFAIESTTALPGIEGFGKDPWLHLAYSVTISRNGKPVWSGPYKLGIGHVKIPHKTAIRNHLILTNDEGHALSTIQLNPYSKLLDQGLHASLMAKLANAQKVKPKLADVLHSIISDGAAHFDSKSFADWAGDFGYSDDSISALETFNACVAIGRTLQKRLGLETIQKLRELLCDY